MKIEKSKHRPSKLTGLYKQKEKLAKRQEILRETVKKGQLELGKLNKRLKAIENELNSINITNISVTAHACIRFQERIQEDYSYPVNEIYKKIVTPELIKMVDTLGNGTYPVDNFLCVVQDRRVITVFTKESNIEI